MGTHDLDTIQGPFTYEALPHKDIKFVPLNKDVKVDGDELMDLYAVSFIRQDCMKLVHIGLIFTYFVYCRKISISVNFFISFAIHLFILLFLMPIALFVLFLLLSTLITPRSLSTPRMFLLKSPLLMNTRLALF